jgi:hypothetical protein
MTSTTNRALAMPEGQRFGSAFLPMQRRWVHLGEVSALPAVIYLRSSSWPAAGHHVMTASLPRDGGQIALNVNLVNRRQRVGPAGPDGGRGEGTGQPRSGYNLSKPLSSAHASL